MDVTEFFKRFANTPLEKRMIPLNFGLTGTLTLQEIYGQVHHLEDYMRPMRMQQKNLIDLAEKFL